MNRWHGVSLFGFIFFFVTGGSWLFFQKQTPKTDLVLSLSSLKVSDARDEYVAFARSCADQNSSYADCVHQFIQRKKDAAITSLQKEWALDAPTIKNLFKRTERMLSYMHAPEGEGIQISFASCMQSKKQLKESSTAHLENAVKRILQENRVHNAKIEVLLDSDLPYPTIYFHDIKASNPDLPHFLLELPYGFDQEKVDFQLGNLEHELCHAASGHTIFVHDLSSFLSERDRVAREEVVQSESISKYKRACEYEADLLPALKHPSTAYNVLLALNSVKIIDEAHPPTRKRKKMVHRVMRLGQFI